MRIIEAVRALKPGKILWWVAIILWCGVIFFHSHKPVDLSLQESHKVLKLVNECLSRAGISPLIGDHPIRKTAHFVEYLVLGFLLVHGFSSTAPRRRTLAYALAAGVLYAVSDEVHQLFVPGRGAHLTDVMIDVAGLVFGIALVYGLRRKSVINPATKYG